MRESDVIAGWEAGAATGRKQMIDWNSEDWGGNVHYADNGSWVADKHSDEGDLTD